MSAARFLTHLRSLGAEVEVNEGRLRVKMARGQLTEELKSAIAAQKGELLALLADTGERDEVPALRPGAPRPLSLFQERLWFLHRLQPESTAYNLSASWLSPGPIPLATVIEAIRVLGEQQASLSTCFREHDGEPEAVTIPSGPSVELRDLRDQTVEQQGLVIEAERRKQLHVPFDLGKEAPARFILFRVVDDRVLTLLVAHHIAVDAWSMSLVGNYISAAYAGTAPPAPPVRTYAEFAAWQRNRLDASVLKGELDWWQKYLAGSPALSTLPSDRPRAAFAPGATREFRFDRALSEGVRALARQSRATVYMALTSALAAALNWYSGQERLLLGSPMGLRERPEFETIVGPFVNVLVLKLDLTENPTFAELLARARGAVLDAHAHRDVPFERLVQRLKPPQSPGHAPLFQAAVVLHNGPAAVRIESGGALFDLSWFVREVDGEFVGGLEYRTDAYSEHRVDELLTRLEAVLRAAVANPEERLSNLPRLSANEVRPGMPAELLTDFERERAAGSLLSFAEARHECGVSGRGSVPIALSDARRAALEQLAGAVQASPSAVLIAAFVALAHRYTGRTEFYAPVRSDAAPSSGRAPVAWGFRAELEPETPFRELVRKVVARLAQAELAPSSLESFASAFTEAGSLPVLCDTSSAAADGSREQTESAVWERVRAHASLHFRVAADGSVAAIDYDSALFDALVVERFAGYFGAVVNGVTTEPELALARVPLLTADARARLLGELHRTFDPTPALSVVELFEQQARQTPDALAVADATGTLTYRELDAAANAIAIRLRHAGVGVDTRVAVGVTRSRAMVVAVLAVLKARGAYLPLDPRYPRERLSYLLEDGEPTVLLLDVKSRGCMPLTSGIPIVEIELAPRPTLGGPTVDAGPVDPDSVAYVLYTSGSTGRPKGVQISHRALTNFLLSMRRRPGLSADDRVIALTTLSFDIAGLELFLPLVTGASVHVAGADVVADGARLADFAERAGATLLQATPSTYRMLIDAGFSGSPRLKLLCGGEALPRELADQLLARAQSLWNLYGPTETTIWSTAYEVKAGAAGVSIGDPIDNTAVYVLDAQGELAPHGVPGEIFIGGAGVARGYFKRPELDAQRFSNDPFLGGGARMYRTGDAGRLLHDGTFEYLGRLDDQVKIRGHRIELGEIESVVREHPGVAAAVVAVREPTPGDARLVGYYVPRNASVLPRDLRELCQRRLPPAMVPSAWVALERIPLTPNGKTDRKALPPPGDAAFESETERISARDELEAALVKIWESVLETRVSGIKESFFDLGGHSLLVARVLARVEKSLGASLPLSVMLESPTIEHLAERIREQRRAPSPANGAGPHFSYVVPIRGYGARPALFCVHGAGGNVLNLYDVATNLPADQPFYGIQAAGVNGLTRPRESIEEMASDYLEEVRVIQPKGPYYLSGYCGGGIIAYEMAQRLRERGEDVALLLLIDAYRPGAFVPSRVDGWKRALLREDLPALLRRAKTKLDRDFDFHRRALEVQYHLLRGNAVPHELREFWLTVSFLRTVENYALKPYGGRLTVLRARETNPEFADQNPDLGWGPLALAGLTAHEVTGDHHTLTREPHVKRLTALLETCLSLAFAESAGSSGAPRGGSR